MILAKAVSAAMKTLQNSTDAQLAEAGIDRTTYALKVMKQIEAEFAKKDAKANATTDAVADAIGPLDPAYAPSEPILISGVVEGPL